MFVLYTTFDFLTSDHNQARTLLLTQTSCNDELRGTRNGKLIYVSCPSNELRSVKVEGLIFLI